MRPQHITAENIAREHHRIGVRTRFNEAAAYHCGKLVARRRVGGGVDRFNEAAAYHCGKHPPVSDGAVRHLPRFNEAAAYHCGKRPPGRRRRRAWRSFNEAAAYHCGKLLEITIIKTRTTSFNEAAAYHCGKPAASRSRR